jgi:hypothetical protein
VVVAACVSYTFNVLERFFIFLAYTYSLAILTFFLNHLLYTTVKPTMPPKKGTRKTATKKSTVSRSKANPATAKLLREMQQTLDDIRGASRGQHVPQPRYGFVGPPNDNDSLDYHTYNGRQYARINCAAGKQPDYETGRCRTAALWNAPCDKGEVNNPITGICTPLSKIKPQVGWIWNGTGWVNVGVPLKRDSYTELGYQVPNYGSIGAKQIAEWEAARARHPTHYIRKYGAYPEDKKNANAETEIEV